MPHGWNIYEAEAEMAMSKIFNCPYDQHDFTHEKCVLRCCDKYTSIVINGQESNMDDTNICTKISFNVYRGVSLCTVHVWRPYE